jgi:hypothetical protein
VVGTGKARTRGSPATRSFDIQAEHDRFSTITERFRPGEEVEMKFMSRKIVLGTVAALALATMVPGEASAQWRGGGWHGGGGGWHGGGWGGGWRGGGWHGGSSWVGPAVAAGIGGLALGALAAGAANPYYYGYSTPYYGYGYGPAYYNGCTWRRGATYDAWGRFVGYRNMQVCY